MQYPVLLTTVLLGFSAVLSLAAAPAKKAAAPSVPAGGKKSAPRKLELGSLTGSVPGDWVAQSPEGQFRLAQSQVPRAAGDTAPALFIVFYFGKGGGGTVEDNMTRWLGMMHQPEGVDVHTVAKRGKSEREGLRITTLDLAGTYQERPTPMSDQVTPRPNYRMLSAVVETTRADGDGPYFVRLVGPAHSVAAAKTGWDAFLASLKAK